MKKKRMLKNFARCFALYGFLPLLTLSLLILTLSVRASGAQGWKTLLSEGGEAALFAVSGGEGVYEETKTIAYRESAPSLPLPVPEKGEGSEKAVLPEEAKKEIYPALPEGALAVRAADLKGSGVINSTSYSVDLAEVRKREYPLTTPAGEEALVLILHTHATESFLFDETNLSDFASDGIETYFLPENQPFRSTDPEKNMVAVGKEFYETLLARGIPALHCTIQHDAEDFNAAYTKAAATIREYLEKYPSIQYVLDLHRDSITRGKDYIKTACTVEGKKSAQVMLVVGTNQLGRHPNWQENLVVQTAFKDAMDSRFPGLARSLYLRTARFNQEFRTGSMLLEIGSSVNTLEEAKTAARAAAESLADLIDSKR